MHSAHNSLSQPEERPESPSLDKVTPVGQMTESILKELNESLCCIVINASTCLRMLAAASPNIERARETAGRTIDASNRAADAVSHLRDLLSNTNKHVETVARSKNESSQETTGGTG